MAQQSAAGHNPSLALLENMTESSLFTPKPTWRLLPNATFCHPSGTTSFLERKAKVSIQQEWEHCFPSGDRLCFFDIACALEAWTPSKCCASRTSRLGRWDCPQVHAGQWSINWCVVCYSSCISLVFAGTRQVLRMWKSELRNNLKPSLVVLDF